MSVKRAGKGSGWSSACWSRFGWVAVCGAATLLVAGASTPAMATVTAAGPSAALSDEQVMVGGISVSMLAHSVAVAPPAPARCSRPTRRRVRSASSRPTGVHAASPAASAGASAGTVPAGYTQVGTVPTGAGTVAVAVDAATGAVYTAHHTGKSLSILVSTGDGGYLNAVTTPLSFAPAIVGGTPPEWCTPPSRPAAPRTPTAAPAAARAAGRQAVLQVGRRACVRRASPARAVPVVPARDRRAARFRPFCPVATAAITEVRSAPVNFSPS